MRQTEFPWCDDRRTSAAPKFTCPAVNRVMPALLTTAAQLIATAQHELAQFVGTDRPVRIGQQQKSEQCRGLGLAG